MLERVVRASTTGIAERPIANKLFHFPFGIVSNWLSIALA
jgi:hypothetical protein